MKTKTSIFKTAKFQSLFFVWIFLLPILIQYIIVSFIPLILSFVVTFYDWSLLGTKVFAGTKNWAAMLADKNVWNSLIVTINYTFMAVVPSVIIGMILALIVNAKVKGANLFKAIYFLPVITSTVVIAGIWRWLFVADETGIINQLLGFFGIPPQFFFGKELALITLALLGIYRGVGLIMVYYYAGLKGISGELYEAAKIDGSSPLNTFFRITLPLLNPTTIYVLIVTTAGALKVFDSNYILFGGHSGGPEGAANTLVYYIYKLSFYDLQMGYGSTVGYLLFAIILVISLIQYFGLKTSDYE